MTRVALESDSQGQARITKLRRWIRKRSPVGKWFARRDADPQSAAADELIDLLIHSGGAWADRAAAYCVLGRMDLSDSDRERAGRLLAGELTPPSLARKLVSPLVRAWAVICSAVSALACGVVAVAFVRDAIGPSYRDPLEKINLIVEIVPLATFSMFVCAAFLIERRQSAIVGREAITAISQIGGPECLVSLHRQMNRICKLSTKATRAMRGILSLVDETWYGRLPDGSRYVLTTLARSGDEEIALAALSALGNAGDGAAAPDIRRIARVGTIESVRNRAAEVLPILLARLEHEQSAAVLLRASASETRQHLVRPAYTTETAEDNLLRISKVPESETLTLLHNKPNLAKPEPKR